MDHAFIQSGYQVEKDISKDTTYDDDKQIQHMVHLVLIVLCSLSEGHEVAKTHSRKRDYSEVDTLKIRPVFDASE